jgi:hypothetical protein
MLVAATPLKFTVLDPMVDPKYRPAIVTDAPTAPVFGVRLVIDGAEPEASIGKMMPRNTTTPDRSKLRVLRLIRQTIPSDFVALSGLIKT